MPDGHGTTDGSTKADHRSIELTASQWERVQALIGDRMWLVVWLSVTSVLGGLCEAGILAITAQAASALVSGSTLVQKSLGPLHLHMSVREVLLIGGGLAVVRLLLQIPISWLPAIIAGDVQATMRRRLLGSYLLSSWEVQSQDREGHFQEMMTNQIMQASAGALQATQFVTSMCTFGILIISAFALNVTEALVVLVAAIVLFAILRPARNLGRNLARRLSAAQLEYAGSVGEANRVTEETNVFGTADAQVTRVEKFILSSRHLYMRAQLILRLVPNVYQSMIYFILVFGLLAASLASVKGYSALGAIVLLLVRAGTYGQQVQNSLTSMRQTLPYVERLQALSHAYEERAPKRGTAPMKSIDTIAFDSVAYGYTATRPVIRGLSFEVRGGETIGVVGPSGAGKSTLVQILLRLRAPQGGRYLVNGTDAADIDFDDWHERVSYVPQAPKLIHATVADNVRFFRDHSDAEVERACKLARIHDEIMTWSDGYDTIVGPRADAVSGGQQQRLCLARALVSQPSVLVLDEPTSALDPRSEFLIQESLESLQSELTLFIIAHRMSTLTICNRVMVVLEGSLDAFDTLEELTASNAYYRFASGLPPVAAPTDLALAPVAVTGDAETAAQPGVAGLASARPDGGSTNGAPTDRGSTNGVTTSAELDGAAPSAQDAGPTVPAQAQPEPTFRAHPLEPAADPRTQTRRRSWGARVRARAIRGRSPGA